MSDRYVARNNGGQLVRGGFIDETWNGKNKRNGCQLLYENAFQVDSRSAGGADLHVTDDMGQNSQKKSLLRVLLLLLISNCTTVGSFIHRVTEL